MSAAGMAEVIAAHKYEFLPLVCGCGVACGADEDELTYAAHIAEELTKAGYGDVQDALVAAADEMPIETLGGADKASAWLRERAKA